MKIPYLLFVLYILCLEIVHNRLKICVDAKIRDEDTLVLHEETRLIKQNFRRDRLVAAGDFNAYTSNLLEVKTDFLFKIRMQKSYWRSSGYQRVVMTCLGE